MKFTDAPQSDDATTERAYSPTSPPKIMLTTSEVSLKVVPRLLLALEAREAFGFSVFGCSSELVCLELVLLVILKADISDSVFRDSEYKCSTSKSTRKISIACSAMLPMSANNFPII